MFPALSSFLAKHFPMLLTTRTLTGTRYHFTATVDGDDIVVSNVPATWFGGSSDPEDDGQTASGISTKGNNYLLGCALPMDNGLPGDKNPCQGSPLPKFPWGTVVVVTNMANALEVSNTLIDYGPSAPPKATAAIDLTPRSFLNLGGKLGVGRLLVSYRVVGGAKYLKS